MKDFFKMWTPSEAYEKLFETFQDKEDLIDERDFKRDFETWLLKKSRPCESKEDFVKKYRSKLFSRIVFFNSKRVFKTHIFFPLGSQVLLPARVVGFRLPRFIYVSKKDLLLGAKANNNQSKEQKNKCMSLSP